MTTLDEQKAIHSRRLAEYYEYLGTHSVKTSGGAEISMCPLCPEVHLMCSFETGFLGCVVKDCRNPHHRPGTVWSIAMDRK